MLFSNVLSVDGDPIAGVYVSIRARLRIGVPQSRSVYSYPQLYRRELRNLDMFSVIHLSFSSALDFRIPESCCARPGVGPAMVSRRLYFGVPRPGTRSHNATRHAALTSGPALSSPLPRDETSLSFLPGPIPPMPCLFNYTPSTCITLTTRGGSRAGSTSV